MDQTPHMKCPRCQSSITAAPDPEGFLTCPGCGARLRSRSAPATVGALNARAGPDAAGRRIVGRDPRRADAARPRRRPVPRRRQPELHAPAGHAAAAHPAAGVAGSARRPGRRPLEAHAAAGGRPCPSRDARAARRPARGGRRCGPRRRQGSRSDARGADGRGAGAAPPAGGDPRAPPLGRPSGRRIRARSTSRTSWACPRPPPCARAGARRCCSSTTTGRRGGRRRRSSTRRRSRFASCPTDAPRWPPSPRTSPTSS